MRKRKHTAENLCFKVFHNENIQHAWISNVYYTGFSLPLAFQKLIVNQVFKVLGWQQLSTTTKINLNYSKFKHLLWEVQVVCTILTFAAVQPDPNSPDCYWAARPVLHLVSAASPSPSFSLLPASAPPPPLPAAAGCTPHSLCSPPVRALAFLPSPKPDIWKIPTGHSCRATLDPRTSEMTLLKCEPFTAHKIQQHFIAQVSKM